MSLFVYVSADIIHLVKIVLLCDIFFEFQRREIWNNKLFWGCISFFLIILSTLICIYDNESVETLAYIAAIIILLIILYNEKVVNVVIASTWIIFVLAMIDTMIMVMYNIAIDLLELDGARVANVIVSILSLLLVYSISTLLKRNGKTGIKQIGIVNLIWYTLLTTVDAFVVNAIAVMNAELVWEEHRNIYLVAVIFVIIGIFIQLVAVILLLMQRNVYKEKKQLTEKYLNEQKNYYEYLEIREQETKKFRHDFRSHLELIFSLAKRQEYEKIDSYLEQMHIRIDELGSSVTVQNGIVDAILNQYYTRALLVGVNLEVRGRFPTDCEIDAYDLCTIFSNVLSNALEAAIKTDEKYVLLECRYTDQNVIIVVKNSFVPEQNGEGGWLKSKKGNVDYHGFGLENMKDSINKYHGFYEIKTEEETFILSIIFNNMRKSDYENSDCG